MGEDDPHEAELDRLRRENAELKDKLAFFFKEHRVGAWIAFRILVGRRLAKSLEDWFSTATPSNPIPPKEFSEVTAAVLRRLIGVGVFAVLAFLVPNLLLYSQNSIMEEQNEYFREQIQELRRQINLQEEQGDLLRRQELISTVYDGQAMGLSMRARVEALKALVQLDNKLIGQGALADIRVNLRGVNLSCEESGLRCANLEGSWLPRVDFSEANLRGASFRGADLTDSSFIAADVSGADFSLASIESAAFRERISAAMHTAIEFKTPEGMEDAGIRGEDKSRLLKEIREVGGSQLGIDFAGDNYREDSVLLEYGLERLKISTGLRDYLNIVTKAAKVEGAKLPVSEFEYSISLDQHSRLPLGSVPYRSAETIRQEIRHFSRVDSIQSLANELFGLYQVDIDASAGEDIKRHGIVCVRRGVLRISGRDIEYFEGLSPGMKKEFIHKGCTNGDKFRSRGGMIFKAR